MKYLNIILVLSILISCKEEKNKLPYYDSPDFTPIWEIKNYESFHKIRSFKLINQENQIFTEQDLEDKICVINFIFTTCPGICPIMTNSMYSIQDEFLHDNEVLLISHSVTPQIDSVPVLKRYALEKGVDFKRWKLLTGDRNEIYELGRKYYFVDEDEGLVKDDEVFLHTENFILIDKQRHIRGIYNGLDPDSMLDLIRDINVLKKESI
jgi:protein SCO1/2